MSLGRIPPGVRAQVAYVAYDVSAPSLAEMHAEIGRLGPTIGERRWAGRTKSHMRWTFQTERHAAGCRVRRPVVQLSVEITMPRWRPASDADEPTKVYWRRYHGALLQHEVEHARIAADAAALIVRTLERQTPGLTCEEVGRRANDAAHQVLAEHRQRQVAFDEATAHGAVQIRDAMRAQAP